MLIRYDLLKGVSSTAPRRLPRTKCLIFYAFYSCRGLVGEHFLPADGMPLVLRILYFPCNHRHPHPHPRFLLLESRQNTLQEKIRPLVFRVISSHRDDLVLRAESKEAMNDWLFGFHRALASIIARVIGNKRGGGGGDAEGRWGVAEAGEGGHDAGGGGSGFARGDGFGDGGRGDGGGDRGGGCA